MEIRLETTHLILRPFAESDAKAVSYNSRQPIVAHFMSDMVMETEEAALGWIHWINNEKFNVDVPCVVLAVELKSDHKCIGLIGVAPKQELNNEIEILFEIADEYQNNGYATEASKAMIWWAFEHLGQDMLSAIVKPKNKASRRVIEKLGFIYGDTRVLPYDGADCTFDYFRLYHIDHLPGPEWNTCDLYKAELMIDFFKVRLDGYNDHMLSQDGVNQYKKLGKSFPKNDREVSILDIGCGTGIELEYIWSQLPNAHITCMDLSRDMLDLLVKDYPNRHDQITIIEASYLDWDYPLDAYDFIVSSQTMHHFFSNQKTKIYCNIHKALKPGGCYFENDFYVDAICMKQYEQRYKTIISQASKNADAGMYHIDIPFTIDIQCQLLKDAGFQSVDVLEAHINHNWSGGILKATKEA